VPSSLISVAYNIIIKSDIITRRISFALTAIHKIYTY
jgi:hypothetical protein